MALILLVITASYATEVAYGGGYCGGGGGGGGCGGGGGGSSTLPLTEYEIQALSTAIDEEYMARAIYRKVIGVYGSIEPFSWIVQEEQMHINWLVKLHTRYGLPVPADRWTGNVEVEFDSKQQACEIGAQAEADNAAVYDAMLPGVTHDDMATTFARLRDVSRYRHLPAFQRWADVYESQGE